MHEFEKDGFTMLTKPQFLRLLARSAREILPKGDGRRAGRETTVFWWYLVRQMADGMLDRALADQKARAVSGRR